MKILSVKNNKFNSVFEIELDDAQWKQAFNNTKKNIAKNVSIPGFRKGHVPQAKLDEMYPAEQIAYNTIQNRGFLNKVVEEIMQSQQFQDSDCLDSVKNIEIARMYSTKAPVLNVYFDLVPQVEGFGLKELKEIVLDPFKGRTITDEMAKSQIKMMIKNDAMISEKKDKTVAKGNIAVIDFKGFINDKPFPGGLGNNFELEIGSKSFIDNFEDKLIGCKKGDRKDVNVTFPKDYYVKDLAGKPAKFAVTIKDVKEIEYPELNKEYLAKFGTKATNEKELIAWLKDLVKQEDEMAYQTRALKVINEIIGKKAKLNYYPASLLEMHKNQIIQQYTEEGKRAGHKTLEKYKKYLKLDDQSFEQLLENSARSTLALTMVYDKLITELKLELTEADKDDYLDKLARYLGNKKEEAQKMYEARKEMIEPTILRDKLFKAMVKSCKQEAPKSEAEKPVQPKAPAKKAAKKPAAKTETK